MFVVKEACPMKTGASSQRKEDQPVEKKKNATSLVIYSINVKQLN